MAFDGVVFDLFHTLVAPEAFVPPDLDRLGLVAAVAGADAQHLRDRWASWTVERETTPIDLVDLVQRTCSEPLDDEQRARIDEVFGLGKDESLLRPEPDVVELLVALAERCAVAPSVLSNCHEREVRRWPDSPLAPPIALFGRSSRIGTMKPNPRAYRWVLDRLGVAPADLVYVGNGSSEELQGARAVGFGAVVHCNVFDRRHRLVDGAEQRRRADQADVSVDTLDRLSDVVFQLVE